MICSLKYLFFGIFSWLVKRQRTDAANIPWLAYTEQIFIFILFLLYFKYLFYGIFFLAGKKSKNRCHKHLLAGIYRTYTYNFLGKNILQKPIIFNINCFFLQTRTFGNILKIMFAGCPCYLQRACTNCTCPRSELGFMCGPDVYRSHVTEILSLKFLFLFSKTRRCAMSFVVLITMTLSHRVFDVVLGTWECASSDRVAFTSTARGSFPCLTYSRMGSVTLGVFYCY